MISILHLSKEYGETVAVEDLSLEIEAGEIFALLGPNGAGKSSTVKVLTGLSKPSTGTIRIAGFDVVAEPNEVKRRIGYVPENAHLYESLTADEISIFAERCGIFPERSSRNSERNSFLFSN